MQTEQPWYSVKCVFQHDNLAQREGEVMYEERIVVFKADNFEEAIALGEAEAREYAGEDGTIHYTGFISAYHLFELELASGAEVYSLMRTSNLAPDAFLDRYHDDGSERMQHVADGTERTR